MLTERAQKQVSRLLDRCDDAVAAGDWVTVGRLTQTVLRLDPGNRDALLYQEAAARARVLSPATKPERRNLTVVFCDLVKSSALAESLDPEDLRDVLQLYHGACDEVVARLGGHVANYMGDGILAYFGFPEAREYDAVRAVAASLEIIDAVANIRRVEPRAAELHVRVGVHYGLVVMGPTGDGPRADPWGIVGATANIAARLQSEAGADSVLVSDDVARLSRGQFTFEHAGVRQLKGISEPIDTWFARSSAAPGAVPSGGVSVPLVGRTQELAIVRERWHQAVQGSCQVVAVRGDPGIGKSRLVEELRREVGRASCQVLELRGSPLHARTPLFPFMNHLARDVLAFEPDDSDDERVRKIERFAGFWKDRHASAVALLGPFLGVRAHRAGEPSPDARLRAMKELIFDFFSAWLKTLTAESPLLVAVDDMHWMDPSSLGLLQHLVAELLDEPTMVVLAVRPDTEIPPLGRADRTTEVKLDRLGIPELSELLEQVPGGEGLEQDVKSQLISRCDGVPLFLEELVAFRVQQSGRSAEGDGGRQAAIPASLYESLSARLDALGQARSIAQLGAVLGPRFTVDDVLATQEVDAQTLAQELPKLVNNGVLQQDGVGYSFKHTLIREAAYASLLRKDRARLHRRVAEVMETRAPRMAAWEPEVLAHHFTEAGDQARAVDYLVDAGIAALARYGTDEAIEHLTAALKILDGLPESDSRRELELTVRLNLARARQTPRVHSWVRFGYRRR